MRIVTEHAAPSRPQPRRFTTPVVRPLSRPRVVEARTW
jgi:hypothetical protein